MLANQKPPARAVGGPGWWVKALSTAVAGGSTGNQPTCMTKLHFAAVKPADDTGGIWATKNRPLSRKRKVGFMFGHIVGAP